jgi:hypothetical protein
MCIGSVVDTARRTELNVTSIWLSSGFALHRCQFAPLPWIAKRRQAGAVRVFVAVRLRSADF